MKIKDNLTEVAKSFPWQGFTIEVRKGKFFDQVFIMNNDKSKKSYVIMPENTGQFEIRWYKFGKSTHKLCIGNGIEELKREIQRLMNCS